MKYDHKFTSQILLLHRNKRCNGFHFAHFEGCKNALYFLGNTEEAKTEQNVLSNFTSLYLDCCSSDCGNEERQSTSTQAIYNTMNARFVGSHFHTFGDWSDQERRTFHRR
jgi:hypothetical protein